MECFAKVEALTCLGRCFCFSYLVAVFWELSMIHWLVDPNISNTTDCETWPWDLSLLSLRVFSHLSFVCVPWGKLREWRRKRRVRRIQARWKRHHLRRLRRKKGFLFSILFWFEFGHSRSWPPIVSNSRSCFWIDTSLTLGAGLRLQLQTFSSWSTLICGLL